MNGPACEPSDDNPAQKRSLARFAWLFQYLSLLCCATALLLTFIRFLEFDAPLTRLVRSLNEYHIDYLHNPWLRGLSEGGDRLGSGESLLIVSAVFLTVGYALGRANFKRAGWETLLAHAIAGLNAVVKHLVGRGRPKFMHTDHSAFSPFSGAGWDSFPSGHSMAALAVATVLAIRFPRIRWLMIVLALAVSVSRLFRGSHFLTDILAGAVLGIIIGTVVACPWKEKRASFSWALLTVTASLAALLAVMTTIVGRPSGSRITTVLRELGLLMAVTGLVVYVLIRAWPAVAIPYLKRAGAVAVMGFGLAVYSGSMWVVTVVLLVGCAHWLRMDEGIEVDEATAHPTLPHEAAFGLAVLLMLYTMIEFRGVLPIG